MTDALTLLVEVRARGVELRAEDDGRLRYRPKGALDDALLSQLAEHKPAIIALLADEATREVAEIAWRVAALRPHVARLGPLDPIRLPAVRDGVPPLVSQDSVTCDLTYHKHCASCGAPREIGQIFMCRACQRAHHLVLLELREGVKSLVAEESAPSHDDGQGAAA